MSRRVALSKFVVGLIVPLSATYSPSTAFAKTCSDHPNQAATQTDRDTIDADGDGIYCESLPCPCATAPPETSSLPAAPQVEAPAPRGRTCRGVIAKVVDGGTLKVETGRQVRAVRAVGVDTPESKKPGVPIECGALDATSASCRWAFRKPRDRDRDDSFDSGTKPRKVPHRLDPTQGSTDRYGRALAYALRPETDFARSQIAVGWGAVFACENPLRISMIFRQLIAQQRLLA